MNNSNENSTTTKTKSHEPATKIKTGADLQDMMLDVLGGKTEEVTSSDTANVEDDKAQYHKNIAVTIADAQKQLDAIDESDLRGLPKEYLRRWEVGYLPNYQHQKLSGTRRTPRFIFKLGDDNDPPSINAVLTPRGREFFKNRRGNFGKASEKCLTEGNKLVFNPKALDEEITAVTEGEFDSVSIMFATDESVKVCALGGAGQFVDLKKRLASKKRRPKIVILFDKDEHKKTKPGEKKPGQKGATDLLKELSEIGVVATVKYFDDFMTDDQKQIVGAKIDANEILQKCGKQVLNELTAKIIESAREDFPAIEERIKQVATMKTTTNDKQRRENYSLEIEDLIREINTTITPADLEAHGYLRHSERGSARPDGYCCPWCGSGDGEHKTGALKFITDDGEPHFGCGKCGGGGSVITFLAHVKNLPTRGKEFFDTLKSVADEFNIPYDKKIFEPQRPKQYTTQTFIPDCPLDLEIPFGFSFSRHGIKKLIPKKNGDGFSEIVVSRTPIIVTKRFVEKKSISVEYELAFKTVYENNWIRKIFDAAIIGDARQFAMLKKAGISAQNHKLLADYFDDLINSPTNARKIQSVTMHNQTGWTDENFTEFIYPSPDADYIVRRNGFDFDKELGTRGDAATWKKYFVDAMTKGGAIARVYSGFALAAPLIRPFNIANLQCHLHAESGAGKTALEKLNASIFGNPKEMIRTFEATTKNRQAVAAAYRDLPTFLDELGTISGKKAEEALSQSIYAFSLGNQNQAQRQNGDSRPLVKFYGARLSTGEHAILKKHDPRGCFKRLPQLSCSNLLPDKLAAELHLVSENHYGHFGRTWIQFVIKHLEEIRDQYKLFAVAFTQSDTYEKTLVKSIVAAAVAYQFFAVCIGKQAAFDDAELDNDVQEILKEMPTVKEMSEDTRAIKALSSYVAAHPKHFITEYEANG
ncbi:MAG: DUF927 domain-containing protein, partial [Selenomonadaceae bacterium]|nr:DUF927 domain-containing protein [Selenomonadaceae bacterium]